MSAILVKTVLSVFGNEQKANLRSIEYNVRSHRGGVFYVKPVNSSEGPGKHIPEDKLAVPQMGNYVDSSNLVLREVWHRPEDAETAKGRLTKSVMDAIEEQSKRLKNMSLQLCKVL